MLVCILSGLEKYWEKDTLGEKQRVNFCLYMSGLIFYYSILV